MGIAVIFVLYSLVVNIAQAEVILEADKPFERVRQFEATTLYCCYRSGTKNLTWVRHVQKNKNWTMDFMEQSNHAAIDFQQDSGKSCGKLTLKSVRLSDSGLYQCWLNNGQVQTHGTYLQVFKPLRKTINLSESTKNKILTAEGFLLLLCVLVPCATLLSKSKRLHELEKKKAKREEENIYQGLNLDDCCAAYDQIERSQVRGQYQDVCNNMGEEEEVQLEKP
ncbi:B-cell antigen receptor complex-associated protein alpha chain [Embiotoca jacksoni]|uniref:B-cell antigen receptor complex-associated protein alpha chain n=1 Tax=Embiotoca jacksoni TaxID=100190 RepID=UPI003704C037